LFAHEDTGYLCRRERYTHQCPFPFTEQFIDHLLSDYHGPSLDAKKERLQTFLTSLVGHPQDVTLSLNAETTSERSTAELHLQVMQCTVSPTGRWKSLKKVRGIYITSVKMDEKRYVVMPSSLPDIDNFDTFGRDILLMSAGSLSGRLTRLLDDFLFCYCNDGRPSRLVCT
jgi:hypothetical protein